MIPDFSVNHVYIYSKVTHCAGHILANTRPHQLCCMGNILVLHFCEFISHSFNRNLINATGQQKHQRYRSTETSSMHATGVDCLVALNVSPVVQVNTYRNSDIISQLHTKYSWRLLLALSQAFFASSISFNRQLHNRAATKVITRPIPNMQIIVRMCTCVLLRRLDAKYLCSVHLT